MQGLAKAVLESASGTPSESLVAECLAAVMKADQGLVNWECSLPESWIPKPAADLSAAALSKFQACGQRMDVYRDLWAASIFNQYRLLRLSLQPLITSCVSLYPKLAVGALPFGPVAHASISYRLLDDICAGVPFLLGSKVTRMNDEAIDYPCVNGKPVPAQHRRVARYLTPWMLVAPLMTCISLPFLRADQKSWLKSQLVRIKVINNIRDKR